MALYALCIVFLLLLIACLSGSEAALTSVSRARMQTLEKDGDARAARVNALLADTDSLSATLLSASLLSIMLACVLAAGLSLRLITPAWLALIFAALVMAFVVLVFCVFLPRALASRDADEAALVASGPVSFLMATAGGLVKGLRATAGGVRRLMGADSSADAQMADEEIRDTIQQHALGGAVDDADRLRLVGALDLKALTVEDVMIHRKNIKMLDADMDRRQLVMKALGSPHTRLPLYRGEKEEIIGVMHAKDLLRAALPLNGDLTRLDLESLVRVPWFVPETTPVQDQLEAFLARRMHFALVVDEYGELQGLITLEDILEEIVGHIHDEHDVAVQGVRPQADGSVNVDGWVPIRDLNRATGWHLPDEEAVTVAGLVIHEAQTLPDPGQSFVFHGHRFNILRRQRNQVTGVNVSKVDVETE